MRSDNGAQCVVQSNFYFPDEASKWRVEFFGTKGRLLGDTMIGQIDGGKLTAVQLVASAETPELGGKAAETLAAQLTQTGSTAGVDAITGATMTSEAIFTAMDACLAQAQ